MSREIEDPEYDVRATLANGDIIFGPSNHPGDLVRWVVACFTAPDVVITDDCGGTRTRRELIEQYLMPDKVRGISHDEMHAAVMARWGGG